MKLFLAGALGRPGLLDGITQPGPAGPGRLLSWFELRAGGHAPKVLAHTLETGVHVMLEDRKSVV